MSGPLHVSIGLDAGDLAAARHRMDVLLATLGANPAIGLLTKADEGRFAVVFEAVGSATATMVLGRAKGGRSISLRLENAPGLLAFGFRRDLLRHEVPTPDVGGAISIAREMAAMLAATSPDAGDDDEGPTARLNHLILEEARLHLLMARHDGIALDRLTRIETAGVRFFAPSPWHGPRSEIVDWSGDDDPLSGRREEERLLRILPQTVALTLNDSQRTYAFGQHEMIVQDRGEADALESMRVVAAFAA